MLSFIQARQTNLIGSVDFSNFTNIVLLTFWNIFYSLLFCYLSYDNNEKIYSLKSAVVCMFFSIFFSFVLVTPITFTQAICLLVWVWEGRLICTNTPSRLCFLSQSASVSIQIKSTHLPFLCYLALVALTFTPTPLSAGMLMLRRQEGLEYGESHCCSIRSKKCEEDTVYYHKIHFTAQEAQQVSTSTSSFSSEAVTTTFALTTSFLPKPFVFRQGNSSCRDTRHIPTSKRTKTIWLWRLFPIVCTVAQVTLCMLTV